MSLVRAFAAPLGVLLLVVLMGVIGFAGAQTGLVALALFCAWPFLWACMAWSIRGLRDTYQLVPKPQVARRQRPSSVGEVLN